MRLVLQRAKLPQMIHPVGKRLHVTEEHRAGTALAELVPRAMHVQILLGRFLALGNLRADFLGENLRAPASQ